MSLLSEPRKFAALVLPRDSRTTSQPFLILWTSAFPDGQDPWHQDKIDSAHPRGLRPSAGHMTLCALQDSGSAMLTGLLQAPGDRRDLTLAIPSFLSVCGLAGLSVPFSTHPGSDNSTPFLHLRLEISISFDLLSGSQAHPLVGRVL